jgi:DNA-binding transcriptional regulator YiaG
VTDWTPANIRALKSALGYTHDRMAQECNVSTSGFRAWCADERMSRHRKPSGSALLILDKLAKRAIRREKE